MKTKMIFELHVTTDNIEDLEALKEDLVDCFASAVKSYEGKIETNGLDVTLTPEGATEE